MQKKKETRRKQIIDMVREFGEIPIQKLNQSIPISDETIRKDLIELEEQGIVVRKHGRVIYHANNQNDSILVRNNRNKAEKERIASYVASIIEKEVSSNIYLDSGSTTFEIARLFVDDTNRRVVTNSMSIASLYNEHNNPNVMCVGGELRIVDRAFLGFWAVENIKRVDIEVAVLGTDGINEGTGIGALSYDDKELKEAAAASAKFTVAVFDSSKCAHTGPLEALPWEKIDLVVSDEKMPDDYAEMIREKTRLVLV